MNIKVINTSGSKMKSFCENLIGDKNYLYTESLEVQDTDEKIYILCRPLPTAEVIHFILNYYEECDLTVVTKEGCVLDSISEIEKYCQIMWVRHSANKVRKDEEKSIIQSVPPQILHVEVSHLCNLKCPHCSTGLRLIDRKENHIDIEVSRRLIRETEGKSPTLLMPIEGEPFLFPEQVFSLAHEAKSLFMEVQIATNGHFFTEEVIKGIIENKVDAITVTIDGMTEESYTKYRQNGSLEKVKKGLRDLAAYRKKMNSIGPHIKVQMIKMKHNQHEYELLEEFGKSIGADSCDLKTMALIDFETKDEWLPQEPENIRTRYKYPNKTDYQLLRNKDVFCNVAFLSILINSDLKVMGCCNDWKTAYPKAQGNETTHLMDLWNSVGIQKLRKNLLNGIAEDPMCLDCCVNDFG